ncbi:MAG: hypothetical protein WCQ54_06070, partial [Clostridiaceae bacterium]
LKSVPLLASKDALRKSMEENYGSYVTSPLIEKWINDPQNAPGRLTSSPWPDRIEIQSIKKISKVTYEVKGEIIEITSTEMIDGGYAAKRPITLLVKKTNNRWMIYHVTLGSYRKTTSIVYENKEYGFNFILPESWQDYKILTDKWEGYSIKEAKSGKIVKIGPVIYIRHPKWSEKAKRQDIPIMVFTIEEWNSLQKEEFHIGAAPIGPKELGRNSEYVFALPARYNFKFYEGYEEVEYIINSNSLEPTKLERPAITSWPALHLIYPHIHKRTWHL